MILSDVDCQAIAERAEALVPPLHDSGLGTEIDAAICASLTEEEYENVRALIVRAVAEALRQREAQPVCDCHAWPTVKELHDYAEALEERLTTSAQRQRANDLDWIRAFRRDCGCAEAIEQALVDTPKRRTDR